MNLTLTEIQNLKKVNVMKAWWELVLKTPEQANFEYSRSHLWLIKLRIDSDMNQNNI